MLNEFKYLREKTGLSQTQFCSKFGIPVGTYRNWEQGLNNPPEWAKNLLENAVIFYGLWQKEKEI